MGLNMSKLAGLLLLGVMRDQVVKLLHELMLKVAFQMSSGR